MKLNRKTQRHPAVVDLLGGAPTTTPGAPTTTPGAANTAAPGGPTAPPPLAAPAAPAAAAGDGGEPPSRWPSKKLALGTAAGVAVLALVGGTIWGTSLSGGDQPANTALAATTTAEDDGLPILDLPTATTTTAAPSEVDDECRADRGDQNSGAGVIAAWNHAYYVQRNAAAARALATPNSSVVLAEQLQPFIDGVPVGTNYCVRTKKLSDDVYLVDLSEMRPEGVQRITQTVTTKKIDGKWFVDVFN
ncbi:hypothetical protein [Prescottella agglutinans]|uniref:DUF8176 domain-containing protein n=1 Tax=Prescottella agglutinans TaxID=1644129 RepID=A0ABT6ML75_9NOCA|nr:hypothetical protein [Prescottella agglutinans]MDH6284511.1 hypothetical protein [Prescottella agglutinans]